MSKKMMKRSLALGALMAFVITGSAMAADVTLNADGTNDIKAGIANGAKAVEVTSNYKNDGALIVNAKASSIATYGNNAKMSVEADSITLNTESGTAVLVTRDTEDNSTGNNQLTVTATKGDLIINGTGEAHGVAVANNGGSLTLKAAGTVSVKASENAVYARNEDASINVEATVVEIESTSNGVQNDSKGHAIYADSKGSNVSISTTQSLTIKAVEGKSAVATKSNGIVDLATTGEKIDVTGTVQGNFNITAENGTLTITTTGKDAGLYAQSDEKYLQANKVEAQQNEVKVKNLVVNSGSMSVRAQGANLTVNAETVNLNSADGGIYVGAYKNTGGVEVSEGAGSVTMNVSESLSVDAAGNGVSLASTGPSKNINLECDGVVTINAGGNGVYTRGSNIDAVNIIHSNEINISGSQVTISSTNTDEPTEAGKGHAVFASGSTINISATEKIELNAVEGKKAIYANAATEGNQGSVVVGSVGESNADVVVNGDVAAENSASIAVDFATVNSSLTGAVQTADGATTSLNFNGATWNVTGNSTVTEITGSEANVKVDMISEDAIATVAIKEALTEDTVVNVSGTGAVSDYLAANGKTAEEKFVKSVTTAEGETVDYDGTLTTEEGAVGGAYTLRVDENGELVGSSQAVNTKSDAVSDAGMALKGHWRAHMNDMNKRMGDLRMANGETGVWTRMVRGESEYQGAKMQYNQYQLGYDEKLSVDKRWTVGAAVTFAEGDASYGTGSTEDKSTAFAIYGSKLNNDGTFVDLIARYARIESDLDDTTYGTGDYDANGYSVSAEFGKRIAQGNGLWIEPQFELTYGSVDGAEVNFSNSFKANYDSMDSFIARAGFALGKDIKQGNVYARASYLYDFDGETQTQFEGGQPISEDFGGGWWEVGVGANINLSKATYIYADVEKTFGGEVDTNWQWNLGVRYSF